jgi:hypothetical protein
MSQALRELLGLRERPELLGLRERPELLGPQERQDRPVQANSLLLSIVKVR